MTCYERCILIISNISDFLTDLHFPRTFPHSPFLSPFLFTVSYINNSAEKSPMMKSAPASTSSSRVALP